MLQPADVLCSNSSTWRGVNGVLLSQVLYVSRRIPRVTVDVGAALLEKKRVRNLLLAQQLGGRPELGPNSTRRNDINIAVWYQGSKGMDCDEEKDLM